MRTMSKTIACYTRVSTGHQVDRDSLPFQRKELTNYCKYILHAEDAQIEVFEDAGKSAKNTERPAFQRMMKKVERGEISHVVVYKIDRISRNLVDFASMFDTFKKNGVAFVSMREQFDTSSAMGEAMLKIILVFAELERQQTGERVLGVMIGRAQDGKWNGARMPFGWRWNKEEKHPEHDPIEAPAARLLYSKYLELGSTPALLDFCRQENIMTKRGGRWNTATIAQYLRNPMNKGDYRYNYRQSARSRKKDDSEVIYLPGVFPALVDPELWQAVNDRMDVNAAMRNRPRTTANREHRPFHGLLYCGACGSKFTISKTEGRKSSDFRSTIYMCCRRATYHECKAPLASDVVVGPFALQLITNLMHIALLPPRRRADLTRDRFEKMLLEGSALSDVVRIDGEDLDILLQIIRGPISGRTDHAALFVPALPDGSKTASVSVPSSDPSDGEQEARLTRALERLKKAYLFDDSGMNEREYLSTRQEIEAQIVEIRNRRAEKKVAAEAPAADDGSWMRSVSAFLIANSITGGCDVDFPTLSVTVSSEALSDFFHAVYARIEITERKPSAVTFRNGLTLRFAR